MNKMGNNLFWWIIITLFVVIISILHFMTPTSAVHFHLIYMQSYFIPILIAAFQFGIRGGAMTALAISVIYVPHISLQWYGDTHHTLLGVLQIVMFNIIGYLTGLKAQREKEEKQRYQNTALELKKSLEKLKQQSHELADLEEQLRLSDRLAVVGELTASLAHELRNPLGTIRGAVEILNDELPQSDKQSEFFQMLIQETERMSTVVETYLGFARKQKNPTSQYDVRVIVHNICLILASRARKEQIKIRERLPEQPVILTGDPNDLRQILVNLLMNAMEAMPSSGTINLDCQLIEINGKTEETEANEIGDAMLRLSIKDSGSGMPPELLDEIFKPFYTTKKSGSGLGLSIVKRIVDQNKWKIEVKSQAQKGTTFILSIPVTPNHQIITQEFSSSKH